MRHFYLIILITIIMPLCSASADEIVLANGDRLTGTVKSSDGDSVILETGYSDPIKINRSKVKRISVNEPADIRLTGGEVLK